MCSILILEGPESYSTFSFSFVLPCVLSASSSSSGVGRRRVTLTRQSHFSSRLSWAVKFLIFMFPGMVYMSEHGRH
ncbi:hypothetical protein F5Y18DRAFT_293586 [Xylariaceae sp. FL1019]|nr:hypothetical protein F5Y18DRAFT_293586 [Xylariaceae sp. FL1019]